MANKQGEASHETHFHGSVIGPVHTESGNISVRSFSSSGVVSTKDDFLSALRAFKAELEAARQQGLLKEAAKDALLEVEGAEQEAEKDAPRPERIIKRLENTRAVLVAGAKIATAATAAAAEAQKLISFVEKAIQTVSKVFSG